MAYKLTKNIAKSKSFRWGVPIKKYVTLGITQATLKSLWDKGCEFVAEDKTTIKTKSNGKKAKANNGDEA